MSKYDPQVSDPGLLGIRLLLAAACLGFTLLAAFPTTLAFGQEVEVVPKATPPSGAGTPDAPRKDGQTEATVAVPKELVGEPVLSLEGEMLGDVAKVQVDENGILQSIDAELGGFFGIGSKSLRISAEDFAVNSQGVVLDMTSDEVEKRLD